MSLNVSYSSKFFRQTAGVRRAHARAQSCAGVRRKVQRPGRCRRKVQGGARCKAQPSRCKAQGPARSRCISPTAKADFHFFRSWCIQLNTSGGWEMCILLLWEDEQALALAHARAVAIHSVAPPTLPLRLCNHYLSWEDTN